MTVLNLAVVASALRNAWLDSQPDSDLRHEEGGFILRDESGQVNVERWPIGMGNSIEVPEHARGMRGDSLVIATFHTHPNPAPEYAQEPSLTDVRAVRNDLELRREEYEGEYVISRELVYRINRDGSVETVGRSAAILGIQ